MTKEDRMNELTSFQRDSHYIIAGLSEPYRVTIKVLSSVIKAGRRDERRQNQDNQRDRRRQNNGERGGGRTTKGTAADNGTRHHHHDSESPNR